MRAKDIVADGAVEYAYRRGQGGFPIRIVVHETGLPEGQSVVERADGGPYLSGGSRWIKGRLISRATLPEGHLAVFNRNILDTWEGFQAAQAEKYAAEARRRAAERRKREAAQAEKQERIDRLNALAHEIQDQLERRGLDAPGAYRNIQNNGITLTEHAARLLARALEVS